MERLRSGETRHGSLSGVIVATLAATLLCLGSQRAAQAQAAGPCVGDCDDDGECTIEELVLGVNIGLGFEPVNECPAFDANGDGYVRIDELILGMNNGLSGCLPDMPECESAEDCDDGDPCTEDVCRPVDGTCGHVAACDDFNDCTTERCYLADGSCSKATPVADGTSCAGGTCQSGACVLSGSVLPCTEQGIRNAIAAGGDDPYTFDCDDPTTVVTEAEIVIDNDVVLDGEGKLTVDGGGAQANVLVDKRVFFVAEGVTAELRGFTITGGAVRVPGEMYEVVGSGGGILNEGALTLESSTVSGNAAWSCGGGVCNRGWLDINQSTISENTGGGVGNDEATLFINQSTVSENTRGGIHNAGVLIMINSTVSGNSGGGIGNSGGLAMVNSTVSGNTSDEGGDIYFGRPIGGPIWDPPLYFTVMNSILDGTCSIDGRVAVVSYGYNIESPGNTCGLDATRGDQFNVSAEALNLGPLQDNGGPTETHALPSYETSVAIGAIPSEACAVQVDQRDENRGGPCDVGSFRHDAPDFPPVLR